MPELTTPEALVAVAVCAAYADGTMGAEEDARLEEHLAEAPALAALDEEVIRGALRKAAKIADAEGDAALLDLAARSLTPALRETAFCLAADLVLADGDIAAEERGFIDRLRRHLGVEDALASRIVEVVLIRHRA